MSYNTSREHFVALAFGPEPQSLTEWANLAEINGGRLNPGRTVYETSVSFKPGHVWDGHLGAWIQVSPRT